MNRTSDAFGARAILQDKLAVGPQQSPSLHTRIQNALKAQKLVFLALVDSGAGTAMSGALPKGGLQQLASIFCLPIGDNPAQQAAAFTAAMALWPLIAPLKDKVGSYAEELAEHNVVTSNTVSVRMEGAIEIIARFCQDVSENPQGFKNFDSGIVDNILMLSEKASSDAAYLVDHIHEIEPAMSDKATKSGTIRSDIQQARRAARVNDPQVDVTIHTQDQEGGLPHSYELFHRILSLLNSKVITTEQYDNCSIFKGDV